MDTTKALIILTQALDLAQKSGVYGLKDSHKIFVALEHLKDANKPIPNVPVSTTEPVPLAG